MAKKRDPIRTVLEILVIVALVGLAVWVWGNIWRGTFGLAPRQFQPVPTVLAAPPTQLPQANPPVELTATPVAPTVANALVSPVLHHADSQPPENGVGSFDVGVKQGQIGLAFGWHISWPKGGVDAGGGGCDLVILTPGWYENIQVTDGRYEVYDVPSSDYPGWVKVLGQERADEQAGDYGCPTRMFQNIPQWESTIPSPP